MRTLPSFLIALWLLCSAPLTSHAACQQGLQAPTGTAAGFVVHARKALLVGFVAWAASMGRTSADSSVGLIGYFDGDCPDGWEEYEGLIGRVPVGSGTYVGVAEDGSTEARAYLNGEAGGEIQHTLNIDEIASHSHSIPAHNSGGGRTDKNNNYLSTADSITGYADQTTDTGGDASHNNMPPYLVLTACKKTESESYASQADIDSLQSDVGSLETGLGSVQSDVSSVEADTRSLQVSVGNLETDVDNFRADSCAITCPSSDDNTALTLSGLGIGTGTLGFIFGCIGSCIGAANCFIVRRYERHFREGATR